ncbi:MAG: hypothetical protein GX437_08405 [Sphingobacteriales bacterium]|nr:hypothetical protein [Sphingobacteriales bacterium]
MNKPMSQGIFWGILIIILGIVLLIKQLANLDIPVFRVMLGVFLVMLGIRLLFFDSFKFGHQSGGDVVFGNKEMRFDPEIKKYDCVFGSMTVDISNIDYSPEDNYEFNAVFGELNIVVNPKTYVKLKSDVVLGNIEIPQSVRSYGYEDQVDSNSIMFKAKAAAVFGSIKFIVK